MTCRHSDADAYMLIGGGVSVRFCRFDDCAEWTVVDEYGETHTGSGLESYQEAIAEWARAHPRWEGAAFLYDLGGHARELTYAMEPGCAGDPDDPDTIPF